MSTRPEMVLWTGWSNHGTRLEVALPDEDGEIVVRIGTVDVLVSRETAIEFGSSLSDAAHAPQSTK